MVVCLLAASVGCGAVDKARQNLAPVALPDLSRSDENVQVQARQLYATLNQDPKLIEFAFILNWPNLKPEEKRTLYSKHASHELSFFLAKKDPDFFKTVIQPYLVNKKDKTFVDHYLLDDDLSSFLQPWNHAQLNIVERTLLAQRLKEERPITARHVSDLFALLPPDIDGFLHLFDTAVKSGSLEVGDPLGLKQAEMLTDTASRSPRRSIGGEARPARSLGPCRSGPAPDGGPVRRRPAGDGRVQA
jgi:hypothetical protein